MIELTFIYNLQIVKGCVSLFVEKLIDFIDF